MDTETKVYVQPSEVGKYQTIYGGPVYPLPNTNETTGVSDITPTTGTASTLHDLQGRRITDTPQSGLYIRNGKKYVVR